MAVLIIASARAMSGKGVVFLEALSISSSSGLQHFALQAKQGIGPRLMSSFHCLHNGRIVAKAKNKTGAWGAVHCGEAWNGTGG